MNNLNLIKKIEKTSEGSPAQWEIKLISGKMIYIRYRWGYLSIRISPSETDNIMDAVNGEEIFGTAIGNGWNGVLSKEKMLKFLDIALMNRNETI